MLSDRILNVTKTYLHYLSLWRGKIQESVRLSDHPFGPTSQISFFVHILWNPGSAGVNLVLGQRAALSAG